MKEVHYQWHIAHHDSVVLKFFLNQLSAVGSSMSARKLSVTDLNASHAIIKIPSRASSKFWPFRAYFVWRLMKKSPSFLFALLIHRTVCIRYQKSFSSWPSQNILSVQAWCVVEVEIFSMNLQAWHLQCSFAQEETPNYEVIHWQHSDCFLYDYSIHKGRSNILYIQAVCRVEELWLSNLPRYSRSIYYIVCNWAELSLFSGCCCVSCVKGILRSCQHNC